MVVSGLRQTHPKANTRNRATSGHGIEVPDPYPAEPIPGFGCLALTAGQRETITAYVLTIHRADSGLFTLRLAWPPLTIRHHRRCVWCRNPWPCAPTEWARRAHAQAAIGRAL